PSTMIHHVTTTRRFASSNVTTESRCYSPSTTSLRLRPRVAAARLLLVAAIIALSIHASWAEDTSVAFNADQLAALDALKVEWGAFSYSTTWTSTAQCLLYPKSPKVAVRWGLNCDADGNVVRLDLHGLGCVGSFASSISKLTALTMLYLASNAFTGSMPAALANVASLHNIDVSNNRLSGSIPAAYSKLRNLESFNISGNQITGTIPDVFTGRNIWALDVSSNTLTGALPKSIGNLPRIQLLNTQTNSLTGKLPTFKSPQLAGLNVANNYFYGPGKVTKQSAGASCIASMPYGGKGEGNCFIPSSTCAEPQKVASACSMFCGTNMITGTGQCKNKGVCIGHPRTHCACKYKKWPWNAMYCRRLM
ncbi:unnamed protein product, partial [Closterium sp. NIES-54]